MLSISMYMSKPGSATRFDFCCRSTPLERRRRLSGPNEGSTQYQYWFMVIFLMVTTFFFHTSFALSNYYIKKSNIDIFRHQMHTHMHIHTRSSRFLVTRLSTYIILKMTSIEEEKLTKNHILLKHKSPTNSKRKKTK